jgi:hypothetical protein
MEHRRAALQVWRDYPHPYSARSARLRIRLSVEIRLSAQPARLSGIPLPKAMGDAKGAGRGITE